MRKGPLTFDLLISACRCFLPALSLKHSAGAAVVFDFLSSEAPTNNLQLTLPSVLHTSVRKQPMAVSAHVQASHYDSKCVSVSRLGG